MDCEQVQEQIEAHVLGMLGQAEDQEVRRHLATCPNCRRLARSYEPIVAGLPGALAAASPLRAHPAVKERVMGGLEATHRSRFLRLRFSRVVAAIAMLLLATSLAWGFRTSAELAHERVVNAELQGKLQAKDQLTVFEVVDSPSTTKLSLRSTDGSSAYGKIFTKADTTDVVVMVNRLPPARAGETYQLWLTSGGETRLAGRLDVDADGFAYLVYRSDRKGPSYQAAMVTVQPPGGKAPGPVVALRYVSAPQ